jgi:cytochrome P450
MEAFRARIEQLVDELLDGLEGKGEIDLVADYGQPLPIIIICDLLGIPFKDREMFQRWAVELVGAGHDPAVVEAASQNVVAYANGVIDDKRDHPEDDMVSALVQGAGEGNDRLTQAEIVAREAALGPVHHAGGDRRADAFRRWRRRGDLQVHQGRDPGW